MRFWFAGLAVLALAACNENAHKAPHSGDQTAIGEQSMEVDVRPKDNTPETEQASALIPTRFRGEWGPYGNCPKNGDSQVTITGTKIAFHESEGRVLATETHTQGLIVSLEMSGEGETWIRRDMLRLSKQEPYGEVLYILPPPDSDMVVRPVLFARCTK